MTMKRGVEVRSLLSTEHLEEVDGRLAILDIDPATGTRFVKFWVDEPLQKEVPFNVGIETERVLNSEEV